MERCPICRARFRGDVLCHRCGSDLSPLLAIEAQARQCEQEAVTALLADDPRRAVTAAERALALQHSEMAATLVAFATEQLLTGGKPRISATTQKI